MHWLVRERFSLQNSEALGCTAYVQGQEGSTGRSHQRACPLPRIMVWVSFVLTIDNVGILCMCLPLSRASLMSTCSRILLSVLLWFEHLVFCRLPRKVPFSDV